MAVIMVLIWIWSSMIYANGLTVIGDWQTIDHQTNQPSSVIHIWKWKGRFYGKSPKSLRKTAIKLQTAAGLAKENCEVNAFWE